MPIKDGEKDWNVWADKKINLKVHGWCPDQDGVWVFVMQRYDIRKWYKDLQERSQGKVA